MHTPIHTNQAPNRRAGGSQQGSVLVLSLLVILALTGLGLVALNTAMTATLTASTFNISKQVDFVTELAVNAGIEEIGCQPENYLTPLTVVQQLPGTRTAATGMRWDGTAFCGQATTLIDSTSFTRADAQPRVQVSYNDNRLASDETGFEAGGAGSAASNQPCYLRLRMEATGVVNIPSRASDSFATQGVRTDIVRRATGYVTVGPFLNSVICANAGSL